MIILSTSKEVYGPLFICIYMYLMWLHDVYTQRRRLKDLGNPTSHIAIPTITQVYISHYIRVTRLIRVIRVVKFRDQARHDTGIERERISTYIYILIIIITLSLC